MPIYSYACSFCRFEFDEIHNVNENSGRTFCVRCGNTAFKVPAIFTPRIFKKRDFADGTKTPDSVNTHSQEKAWMKSEGITFDAPSKDQGRKAKEERKNKSTTAMGIAFKEASDKLNQGFKIENLDKIKQKEVNRNAMRFKG